MWLVYSFLHIHVTWTFLLYSHPQPLPLWCFSTFLVFRDLVCVCTRVFGFIYLFQKTCVVQKKYTKERERESDTKKKYTENPRYLFSFSKPQEYSLREKILYFFKRAINWNKKKPTTSYNIKCGDAEVVRSWEGKSWVLSFCRCIYGMQLLLFLIIFLLLCTQLKKLAQLCMQCHIYTYSFLHNTATVKSKGKDEGRV